MDSMTGREIQELPLWKATLFPLPMKIQDSRSTCNRKKTRQTPNLTYGAC